MKYALQVMPQDRCMMTNYWEKGILYSFDMNYFFEAGVDIDGFDPAFKKYFNNVFGLIVKMYITNSSLNKQDGAFATWTQTSPLDGAWVN